MQPTQAGDNLREKHPRDAARNPQTGLPRDVPYVSSYKSTYERLSKAYYISRPPHSTTHNNSPRRKPSIMTPLTHTPPPRPPRKPRAQHPAGPREMNRRATSSLEAFWGFDPEDFDVDILRDMKDLLTPSHQQRRPDERRLQSTKERPLPLSELLSVSDSQGHYYSRS